MLCLLRAYTGFLLVNVILDVNILTGPCGLVILLVDLLEGASSSVQHPILGS